MSPVVLLLVTLMHGQAVSAQSGRPDCGDWRDCRQRALDAAALRDYESFHDLAWRALRKGPPQDASLMYIVARAQSLDGRPQDALVMLLRLAERGVHTDAPTSEEFAPVRRLPQWPDLETRLRGARDAATEGARTEAAPPPPGPAAGSRAVDPVPGGVAAPPSPVAGAGAAVPASPPLVSAAPGPRASPGPTEAGGAARAPGITVVEEALRVPSLAMTPVALAHDRASGRFVFGDGTGRKLVIVDERMHFVVDLVREASAGFYDITALEIDSRRGDLWVVSAERTTGATALHHVQMVSGRPLQRLGMPEDLAPGRFVDVAVTRDGRVYVLDAVGPRLFSLGPGGRALTVAARLELQAPSSIAPAGDGTVYVAHEGGVSRVDVRTGRAVPVRARGGRLPAFARIRWDAGALVGVERLEDGTCRILRVRIDRATTRAHAPQVLARGMAIPAPSATTVSNGSVYFVSRGDAEGAAGDTVVKRLPLGVRAR